MIKRASVVMLRNVPGFLTRPDAEEVFVIDWPDAGIVIPWPAGDTPAEAIRRWATINTRLSALPEKAFVCEQHPTEEFPHGECAGPGMLMYDALAAAVRLLHDVAEKFADLNRQIKGSVDGQVEMLHWEIGRDLLDRLQAYSDPS